MIISHLEFFDKHALGLISPHFRDLIPPPTYDELLAFEESTIQAEMCEDEPYCRGHGWRQGDWATCPGCKRLRLRTKFGTYNEKIWCRYGRLYLCLECGTGPLPGEFRYKKGHIWQVGEVEMIRCPVCGMSEETMRAGVKGSEYINTARDKCRKCYKDGGYQFRPQGFKTGYHDRTTVNRIGSEPACEEC